MYLKSLELHGFKSFPNRTVMTFDRGATVIVGPNGSGKSNISDAMRWVLGELSSRNLRGTKMEDVIFGGADSKRPMGFAEVSVTFDNSEETGHINTPYDEITVTRRYFRSGNSEYLINRKPCRLRDIFEMFMNTGVGREGYSIIGQGKIAEIISRKSEDRRNFFEEAAGISKYRHRKHEAENTLAKTEQNVLREQDIFSEIEARIGPLEKEAEKAKKYLVLAEEKRAADVALWLYDTEKLRSDLIKYKNENALATHKLESITENLEALENQVSQLELQNVASRSRSEEMLGSIGELNDRMHALDSGYQLCEAEIGHLGETIQGYQNTITDIERQQQELDASSEGYRAKINEISAARQQLSDARLETLTRQQELERKVKSEDAGIADEQEIISGIESELMEHRAHAEVLRGATADGTKLSQLNKEIEGYRATNVALLSEVERCERATSDFKAKIAKCEQTMRECAERETRLSDAREQKLSELHSAQVARDTMLERAKTLRRMEESLEGYGGGVRFTMDRAEEGKLRGKVYGPVSKLITIGAEYVTAIEVALGATAQHLIVDTDTTAKECIEALKQARAGRCTFLPVSVIRPGSEPEEIRRAAGLHGYVDRADRLVSTDKQFGDIVEWMLGRTVVFRDLDAATAAARELRHRVRIVTLDGQIINVGGSMTGGANREDGSGFLSRSAQIAKIDEEAKKKTGEMEQLSKELRSIVSDINENKGISGDAEQNRELLHTMSRAQFAALDQAQAKKEANENLLAKLSADYEELKSSRSKNQTELGTLEQRITELEQELSDKKLARERHAVERNSLDDDKNALTEQANELFLRMTELAKDIEALQTNIGQNNERRASLDGDISTQKENIRLANEKIREKQKQMDINRVNYEEVAAQQRELTDSRRDIESGMSDYTERMAELREKIKKRQAEKELCFKTSATLESKIETLTAEQDKTGSHLYEEYELTYEDAVALNYPPVTKENRSEVAAALTSARNRIRAMGGVNANAVEEYLELKGRYDDMKIQLDDLKRSREELIGIIAQLENEMRSGFLDAFARINENFSVVFRELFGGGQAELLLTEPDDVLTSGIEIRVAPPGKIIKSLSLLSGGEQSFVAIALFFAIIKVNPTPFCILDEVEAALDEVNVARFGAYIKKMQAETQFILITHRRGTMEVAERLYGVTMPEKGISRVIGINVNEIESVQRELLDEIS